MDRRSVLGALGTSTLSLGVFGPASAAPQFGSGNLKPSVDMSKVKVGDYHYPHADLRPEIDKRGLVPRKQRGGMCTIMASSFLIEYMQKLDTLTGSVPYASIEYMNWAANEASGLAYQDGAYLSEVAAGYAKWGAVAETDWPDMTHSDTTIVPSAETQKIGKAHISLHSDFIRQYDGHYGVDEAQVAAVKTYLNQGVPVAAGFRLTQYPILRPYGTVSAVLHLNYQQPVYGHTMAIVGYYDVLDDAPMGNPMSGGGGYFVVRNSGGPDWQPTEFGAEKGYFNITYSFFMDHVADIMAFRLPTMKERMPARSGPVARPKLQWMPVSG